MQSLAPGGQQIRLDSLGLQTKEDGQQAWKPSIPVEPQSTSMPDRHIPFRLIAKPGWTTDAMPMVIQRELVYR